MFFIGIFISVMFFLFFIMSLYKIYKFHTASTWPTTEGEIINSKIKQKDKRSFEPDVEYTYYVNGKMYYSKVIMSSQPHKEHEVRDLLKKYPVGGKVTVYYHPEKPKNALLIPGITAKNIIFSLVNIVVLGTGIFVIIASKGNLKN